MTVEKAKTRTRVRVMGFSYVNVYKLLQVLDLRYIKLLLKRQTLVPGIQFVAFSTVIFHIGGPKLATGCKYLYKEIPKLVPGYEFLPFQQ